MTLVEKYLFAFGAISALSALIDIIKDIDNISIIYKTTFKNKKLVYFLKFCYLIFFIMAIGCAYRSMQVNDVKIAIIFSLSLFAIILTLLAHGLLIFKEKIKDKIKDKKE